MAHSKERFLQVHFLTFYPPSNVNRDDTGNPKTANVGGATRLRISSQALKRAWRTSSIFEEKLEAHMGKRTKRFGREILEHLQKRDIDEKKSRKIAQEIAAIYAKLEEGKDKNPLDIEQLVFISPEERKAAFEIAEAMVEDEEINPRNKLKDLLKEYDTAVDVSLFGRMLTDEKGESKNKLKRAKFSRDAAAQVAHAITTHRVTIEDDYFTAVDDLKTKEDAGSAHLGEMGFGSGVFYLYLCVNRDLFRKNLGLDENADDALIGKALGALIEAAATVSPSGKQNSFAAFARAHYVLAEKGNEQPRTLAGAFAKPVVGTDLMGESVKKLKKFRNDLEKAYGASSSSSSEFEVGEGGSLAEIVKFCQS